jgi:RHS repeat-associated protein
LTPKGFLLAAETQTGPRHFHLDHLGTPRLITRAGGERVAYHVYCPFGEEAAAFNQDTERMKFTGHERDLASPAGAGDGLDYMHARHESPVTGRFLSVDPAGKSFDPESPQPWNRYSYVQNSPASAFRSDWRNPGLHRLVTPTLYDGTSGEAVRSRRATLRRLRQPDQHRRHERGERRRRLRRRTA